MTDGQSEGSRFFRFYRPFRVKTPIQAGSADSN